MVITVPVRPECGPLTNPRYWEVGLRRVEEVRHSRAQAHRGERAQWNGQETGGEMA